MTDLKNANYKLGIISNFDERIYKILENMKILEYFEFIKIPSNSNGYAKPSKEIFLQAIKTAEEKFGKTEEHKFLHIGDSIGLDYRASQSCGFKSILMCHGNVCVNVLSKLEGTDEIKNSENYAIDLIDLKKKILLKF